MFQNNIQYENFRQLEQVYLPYIFCTISSHFYYGKNKNTVDSRYLDLAYLE